MSKFTAHRSFWLLPTCLLAGLALSTVAKPAWSSPAYSFTPISSAVTGLGGPPGLADDGRVVFQFGTGNSQTIAVGSGGASTSIATTSGFFQTFFDAPAISSSGNVVSIQATPTGGINSIFTATQGAAPGTFSFTKIVDASGDFADANGARIVGFECIGGCDVNDAGTVVFPATNEFGGDRNIYVGDGGVLKEVFSFLGPKFDPAIRNSGRVAARFGPGAEANLLRRGPAPFVIVASATNSIEGIGPFALSNSGVLSFEGEVVGTNVTGIFTGTGNAATNVADSTGPYQSFDNNSISALGQVVFEAELDVGNIAGIFRGPNPVSNKVIAPGDVLFGKVVDSVTIGRDAINKFGQIAFRAEYADGTAQILRADPIIDISLFPPGALADFLNLHAQLTTGRGTGASISRIIDASDLDANGNTNLSFDIEFLTPTGLLTVSLGGLELGRFGAADSGLIVIRDIDLRRLFDPLALLIDGAVGPARDLLLEFVFSGPAGVGSTVRIDDLVLFDARGTQLSDDFERGTFDPAWQFDTSGGGSVLLNALDTSPVPEPAMLTLFGIGLFGLGLARQRRRKDRVRTDDSHHY